MEVIITEKSIFTEISGKGLRERHKVTANTFSNSIRNRVTENLKDLLKFRLDE